jgi:putative Mn2+ efflux pump MntP
VSPLGILLLAVGLAADATAVSATRGMATATLGLRHYAAVALAFGVAQAVMPVFGWLLGRRLGVYVAAWDHWIAFVLLAGIGLKMLWESRKQETPEATTNPFGVRLMIILAIATSIDALAVGVTLPLLDVPLVPAVITIGVVTAVLSMVGLWAGRRFGALLGKHIERTGAVLLIAIGLKILIEHLVA